MLVVTLLGTVPAGAVGAPLPHADGPGDPATVPTSRGGADAPGADESGAVPGTISDGEATPLPPLPMADTSLPFTEAHGFEPSTERPVVGPPDPASTDVGSHAGVVAATLSGTLRAPGTAWATGGSVDILADPGPSASRFIVTTLWAEGDYAASLAPGSYTISYYYRGSGNLVVPDPVTVTVTGGEAHRLDITLLTGATISGSLTAEVGAVAQPRVAVIAVIDGSRTLLTDNVEYGPGSQYRVFGLAAGDYLLYFESEALPSPVVGEYWRDARDPDSAQLIHLEAAQTLSGIDVELQNSNTFRGVVRATGEDGALKPVPGARVEVVGWSHGTVLTGPDGSFDIHGFTDGSYALRILAGPSGPRYGTIVTDLFTFDRGGSVVQHDAVLALGGGITGSVRIMTEAGGALRSGAGVAVEASLLIPETGEFRPVTTIVAAGTSYAINDLGPGRYLLRFSDQQSRGLRAEYFDDTVYRSDATLVEVRSAANTSGVSAVLEPWTVWTYRYGGADRYEVAANITHDAFAPGVPVLYIASGEGFADALSAGPAAAHQDGALLLVSRTKVPEVTRAAISELKPKKIVVVGGTATISEHVVAALARLQPDIVRISGADRYEVSRNIIDYAFCNGTGTNVPCTGGAATVFLATGSTFPDALSAGPAAAHVGGAVLLVPGSADHLDAPSTSLLARLGTSRFFIAGGGASVSASIESQLTAAHPGAVSRLSGEDRYEASAAINAAVFDHGETAFVASGAVFADALSGGPTAAILDAPLFLMQKDCVPEAVWRVIYHYDPVDLIFLGGPNTLSDSVVHIEYLC